jgi:hypothetical protein
MQKVEIARSGDATVADQMEEMLDWLHEEGIEPLDLQPVRIVRASVRFRAAFATAEDAERFCLRFNEEASADTA